MSIHEFLLKARGRVSIVLNDGSKHTGRFREDILSESALSAYFFGDNRDISLPIDAIIGVEAIDEELQLAS